MDIISFKVYLVTLWHFSEFLIRIQEGYRSQSGDCPCTVPEVSLLQLSPGSLVPSHHSNTFLVDLCVTFTQLLKMNV